MATKEGLFGQSVGNYSSNREIREDHKLFDEDVGVVLGRLSDVDWTTLVVKNKREFHAVGEHGAILNTLGTELLREFVKESQILLHL